MDVHLHRRRAARITAILLVALPPPLPARGQIDSLAVTGATLRTWEEQVRLAIYDRGGAFSGRLSERGLLQRFQADMDPEYDLDRLSSSFGLTEDHEWHRRENGARFWAGSIDHLQLVQRGELKASVGLGGSWAAGVRFHHEESLRARRNLVALQVTREVSRGRGAIFLSGTLKARKPETDLEAGFMWRAGANELTLAVGALDLFSDLIYQSLEVAPEVADSALDYTAHPFAFRTTVDLQLTSGLRAEVYGLLLTPTRLSVESQANPGSGFVQEEAYGYAGGLIEWTAAPGTAFGGFGTWVRGRSDRAPLRADDPVIPFDLTERTWRVGAYGIHRSGPGVSLEALVARIGRDEVRRRPEGSGAANVDYDDRTWVGRADLTYAPGGGLRGVLGLDFTLREASGPPPEGRFSLARDDLRLRADVRLRPVQSALFVVGANLDLDVGRFDGAHGRFLLLW